MECLFVGEVLLGFITEELSSGCVRAVQSASTS